MFVPRSLVAALPLLLLACSGLRPRLVDASVQKPSNVAVYFTVNTSDRQPVPGLSAEQFRIYEDEKLVSKFESKQTILNPEVSAMHYLLLLVDMSASVTQSGSAEGRSTRAGRRPVHRSRRSVPADGDLRVRRPA